MTGNFKNIREAKAYAKRNGLSLVKTEKLRAWYLLKSIKFIKAHFI